jgi:excisionase family DNA binding protein
MSAVAELQSPVTNPNELLTDEQAAALLGVKPQTLAAWRMSGRYGLPFLKIGRLVRYRRGDLERWLESRRTGAPAELAGV